MKNHPNSHPIDYQAWLDRLATGELDDAKRRALFTWLDDEPLRWKRCAVAFLEAQWWGDATRPLVEPAAETDKSRLPAVIPAMPAASLESGRPSSRGGIRGWIPALSLAACALLVFSVGFTLGKGTTRLSGQASETASPEEDHSLLASAAGKNTAGKNTAGNPTAAKDTAPDSKLNLANRNGPADRTPPLAIPVLIPSDLLAKRRPDANDIQVRSKRRYVTVTTKDGKQIYVPVEQLSVQPHRGSSS